MEAIVSQDYEALLVLDKGIDNAEGEWDFLDTTPMKLTPS